MDPTERFTDRVGDYVKARPSYPRSVLSLLTAECGLGPTSTVADLGSGTGIFARLLLESGATVYGVEPNAEMRRAAERDLGSSPGFRSVDGRAEATTLPAASVDLVTAAQALHWFDLEAAAREMKRIGKPGAPAAIVYNDRDTGSTPFLRGLEALLVERCPRYLELQGRSDARASLDALFGPGRFSRRSLPNEQRLDRAGLVARVMSASYAPKPGTEASEALRAALEALFDRHAEGKLVRIAYATVVTWGQPRAT